MQQLNLEYKIEEIKHSSFIEGRAGRIYVKGKDIAYIGEISPKVLTNFNLNLPVSGFELNLTEISKIV
jgi:phenylalanyl-tRNA synthetase beta chain